MSRNRQSEHFAGFHLYYSELHQQWLATQGPYVRFAASSKYELKETIKETL